MPKDIAAEIKALHKMTTGELAERYEELDPQRPQGDFVDAGQPAST